MISKLLYNLSMQIIRGGLLLLSPFHSKAAGITKGNKKALKQLKAGRAENPGKYIWFHCASLGEFEQGRPVIERLKKEKPEYKILLTFFSPSGYEVRKDYSGADIVSYLPLDTKKNAREFIRIARPEIAVFVKYEFWLHYLQELQAQHIPAISISSVFRPGQIFFKKYGTFYRNFLQYFEHFFVQDEVSRKLLKEAGFNNVTIGGDTRFDRVLEISKIPLDIPAVKAFTSGHRTLVIGSSWPQDLELLQFLFKVETVPLKYIIAPHEIDPHNLLKIEKSIVEPVIRYSQIQDKDPGRYRFMIVDTIGILSSLYRYGDLAYVGGAFGQGLHNILEPAAFGIPVLFGKSKKNKKYLEAGELVKAGGAFDVNTSHQLINTVKHLLQDAGAMKKAGTASKQYILNKTGATETILKYLLEKLN